MDCLIKGALTKRDTRSKHINMARNKIQSWRDSRAEKSLVRSTASIVSPTAEAIRHLEQIVHGESSSEQEKPNPNFQLIFLALPGEIRNMIYENLAPPPWGWVDIQHFKHQRIRGAGAFAQLHPLIAKEYHGCWCPKVSFLWQMQRHTPTIIDFAPWTNWLANFNEDEARHIRTIHFRFGAFHVKVIILDPSRKGQELRITFVLRGQYWNPMRTKTQPFVGFQNDLNWIASVSEERKETLDRVARAVARQWRGETERLQQKLSTLSKATRSMAVIEGDALGMVGLGICRHP